ncbi:MULTISPECIES: FHA domain-containing protein [Thermoanaerobacterium]|uniref:FHA domain-containing protein n=2 Tax=Thermoanaerobacterium TaxID=28895 RepID=W9E993_9THEO|nr:MULTISPECIES: FHA domain-containing protein [Thermoanaerobacterium]HHV74376.1 FHA domain-containing protein [Thermoanaerobacterium sp.]AFK86256.1 FHA domain containing protein [Thermoanaerobacterium saccharolyticum JW/SL-YS485]ETO37400.1 FHA domain-containing protein [Thermoanaerobacterium aotearoense SCUT27]MDE4541105.1 FHA domain-containing protein [Thermoanaerobacterium sp. R66]ORX23803.1 FHA domain-containing protein [Thermoanaerobacterium sp. PSU-2]
MYQLAANILKYVLLLLIYLFLYRVFKIIYLDIKGVRKEREITKAKLVSLSGMGSFNLFEVTTIGRADDCDIVVDNPYVSSKHAMIRKKGKKYIIQDLNSTNGTFVNGRRVKNIARLKNEDVIKLGNEEYRFLI